MNRLRVTVFATAVVVAFAVTGCGGSGVAAEHAELKRLAASCPAGKKVASYIAWDVNTTQRGKQLTSVRLAALGSNARQVAACGGRLRVVGFGPTAAATARLWDGALEPPGATENARLRHVPDMADEVVRAVEKRLPAVLRQLSGKGTDPVGQFAAAEQYLRQLPSGFELRIVIASSGISTHGIVIDRRNFSESVAVESANRLSVPDLSGAIVTIAGLGKVGAGAPPPTAFVDALRVFYERVCKRTKARSCLAVTDIAPLGG